MTGRIIRMDGWLKRSAIIWIFHTFMSVVKLLCIAIRWALIALREESCSILTQLRFYSFSGTNRKPTLIYPLEYSRLIQEPTRLIGLAAMISVTRGVHRNWINASVYRPSKPRCSSYAGTQNILENRLGRWLQTIEVTAHSLKKNGIRLGNCIPVTSNPFQHFL